MGILFEKDCNAEQISPLGLAFVGDTVFDLFVREMLLCEANRPVKKLHNRAAKIVNASSQARAARELVKHLTEAELSAFKRGKNAHTNHTAKNASECDYHFATGLEALFGYLYLKGETERLRELFNMAVEIIDGEQ